MNILKVFTNFFLYLMSKVHLVKRSSHLCVTVRSSAISIGSKNKPTASGASPAVESHTDSNNGTDKGEFTNEP